ncbi:MAG: ribokinase [Terrimicrobiaceae bacterium]
MPAKIAILGSLNIDIVTTVAHLPAPVETVMAHTISQLRGGKGANQTLAATRHGAIVSLIGCLGDEEDGASYRRFLEQEGVDASGLVQLPGERTGTALIVVDKSGENQIVVVPGANGCVTRDFVSEHAELIRGADVLLVQMETTLPALLEAIRIANGAGVPVILNPSPLRKEFPWGTVILATLIINETEAAELFRFPPASLIDQYESLREQLPALGASQVVITRGGDSTICVSMEKAFEIPTLAVDPVDTVGAGDTFAGVLAVRLAEGEPLHHAALIANCAGALATLQTGAQEAIPKRADVEAAAPRLE